MGHTMCAINNLCECVHVSLLFISESQYYKQVVPECTSRSRLIESLAKSQS